MTKKPANHGKSWTPTDNAKLRELAKENTPTRVMGIKLGRTPGAVYDQASELGLSVKPVNQRPNKGHQG